MELFILSARYGGALVGAVAIIVTLACLATLRHEYKLAWRNSHKRAIVCEANRAIAIGASVLAAATVAFLWSF